MHRSDNVTIEAEIGVIWPQAKVRQGTPATPKDRNIEELILSHGLWRKHGFANTLILP